MNFSHNSGPLTKALEKAVLILVVGRTLGAVMLLPVAAQAQQKLSSQLGRATPVDEGAPWWVLCLAICGMVFFGLVLLAFTQDLTEAGAAPEAPSPEPMQAPRKRSGQGRRSGADGLTAAGRLFTEQDEKQRRNKGTDLGSGNTSW